MFNVIIFSKDRACQLDLLIRSINKYYRGSSGDNVKVLYTYSTEYFKEGYGILKDREYGIDLVYEGGSSFKELTENLIDPRNPYTFFLVDDDVFKNPFDIDCKEMEIFKSDEDIACLSLRMHPGINYCYTIPCDSPAPEISPDLTWKWRGEVGDWGYPMSLDGHIFRTSDILPLMKSLDYSSPNTLEGTLANHPLSREKMVCLKDSVIVNNPCNKVQTDNANHCGDISAEFLNNAYLNGGEISMINIHGVKNTAPHTELEILIGTFK
jgi:hypothetical protein